MGFFSDIQTSQAPLAFVLGGVLFLAGALLIVIVVRQFVEERKASKVESLLAPVLAADTLIPRLRVMWVKSMLLQAEADDASVQAASGLAREIRRCIIRVQALVVAGEAPAAQNLEARVAEVLTLAIESIRDETTPEALMGLQKELAKKRTALGESPRAAEPDASVH